MSLDIYLKAPSAPKTGTGILYRENGRIHEITYAEWNEKFPNREPVTFIKQSNQEDSSYAFSANITHNLNKMAEAADLYKVIWRPEENGVTYARELISILEQGLSRLIANPEEFKKYNPSNGWGTYEVFVEFVKDYLDACKKYPDALVKASR